ncbi:hypothetical protein QU926_18320 [Pseudomonas asiatica]|uniref:hypothetical protein n=1 Tax=Pseudomonas asiatica TaxID=2219225 RepID=UPI0025AB3AC5|nr:hypothetical protein [Pseudomonas asiatica]MDM9555580.1 hypothetical protein [Pseudomonas asiatica]
MDGSNENKVVRRSIDWFSVSLVTVVMLSAIVAFAVYRQAFSAGLSHAPDNWSAFGGFIGGLFGPLISFLTLLAILKTIDLQKQLLKTQRSEFEELQALQAETLRSQRDQIDRANADADRRVLEESRLNLLRTIDNYTAALNIECDTKRRSLETLMNWVMDGKGSPTKDEINKCREKIRQYEKRLAAVMLLYGDLCFEDFNDVSSMKEFYKKEMEKIWSDPQPSPEPQV